ncbi:hypothetical protein L0Z65_12030 [Phaeobacter sp. BS52]
MALKGIDMGNFFISAFEKLVGVVVVLLLLAVVGGAVLATMQPGSGGILAALGVLVVGTLYVILIAQLALPRAGDLQQHQAHG